MRWTIQNLSMSGSYLKFSYLAADPNEDLPFLGMISENTVQIDMDLKQESRRNGHFTGRQVSSGASRAEKAHGVVSQPVVGTRTSARLLAVAADPQSFRPRPR